MRSPNRAVAIVGALAGALAMVFAHAYAGDGANQRGTIAQSPCHVALARFLRAPTPENLDAVPKANGVRCGQEVTVAQLQQLDSLVSGGNVAAARLLAPLVRHQDGGEIEDALRSLGRFSSLHMSDFIGLAKAGALSTHEMTDAVTMLPLDMEDDFDAQFGELQKRRSALKHLSDSSVQELVRTALESIDAFVAEIERARSAIRVQKQR